MSALRSDLLERMLQAWATDGSGVLDVGLHYVQWAKFPEGLQVECISNNFVEGDHRLGFIQRRKLDLLGLHRPDAEVPNYYRRFTHEEALPEAADLLVRVVEEVLDDDVVSDDVPPRGNVCFVVPLGKCGGDHVRALARPMVAASQPRADTVVLDALTFGTYDQDAEAVALESWLSSTEEAPPYLRMSCDDDLDLARVLAQAAVLVRACRRLREEGAHVIVLGPNYLTRRLVYDEVVSDLADGVVAVVMGMEAEFLCPERVAGLFSGPRYTVLAALECDEAPAVGARWTFTDALDAGQADFHPETAGALGLHGIAGEFTDAWG